MKLIYKLRNSPVFKKTLFVLVLFFTFLYVFAVPSFGEATSVLRYLIYVSMLFLGATSILYCILFDSLRINKVSLFIPLFAVFSLIGTMLYSKEFRSWFSLVLLASSFYIFIYAFKAIKNKLLVVSIISLGLFLFSLYFLFYYRNEILNFRSYGLEAFRLGSYFDNPNGVSAYAVLGVASSLFVILFEKKVFRFCFSLPLLTNLLVGITTGSKTFILAIGVFAISLLFFRFKNHKIIFLISLGILIGIGLILINLPFLQTLKVRIVDAFQTLIGISSKADTSTIERVVWIDYGFYLGARNVLFGLGVNGFSHYSGIGTYSHSNFAEVLCDFGLIGFIIFHLPLLLILFRALFKKGTDKSLVLPFILYYLLIGFSNVYYYKKFYFLILAFLFYLTFVESEKQKSLSWVEKCKRVIFTCDSMDSGGAEKVIASIANSMAKKGIDVSIIGVSDLKEPSSFYKLENVVYTNLTKGSGKRINSVKRVFALRKTIKDYKPDVVISFLPHVNVYTSFALVSTGIPHIVSERNDPRNNPKGKILRLLKYISFYFSNGCVFQTRDSKAYYCKKIQEKSIIISNPINILYHVDKPIRDKEKVVLSVGRLEEQKNLFCLFDAFKKFNEKKENSYRLRVYGEGSLKNELIEYSKRNQINDYVEFMGTDNNWHEKEYRDAMFVLSSDYEGMPNSLAEAMALGIPCVSTNCPIGGPGELIKDSVNGFLVPVNDSDSLSSKMIEIVDSKSLDILSNLKLSVLYSSENITDKWIGYIESLKRVIYG